MLDKLFGVRIPGDSLIKLDEDGVTISSPRSPYSVDYPFNVDKDYFSDEMSEKEESEFEEALLEISKGYKRELDSARDKVISKIKSLLNRYPLE